MRPRPLAYWISTAVFSLGMITAGCIYVARPPALVALFGHLGYPRYFPFLLGPAKIVGAAVLVAPGLPRAKEWAYAGFAITCVAGFVSHLAVGDGALTANGTGWGPTLALSAVLVVSYLARPTDRRL